MILIFVILAANAGRMTYPGMDIPDNVLIIRSIAYILAILAGLTDLLDGYLARKWNQITDFGALMDPLADKVFVTATMLMAVEYKLMPAWIAVAVLSREFMVTGLRTLAAKSGVVISADRWGKLKTALQMIMLALAGLAWLGFFDLTTKYTVQWYLWMCFLCGIVAVTFFSGIGYFVKYRDLIFHK